MGAILVAAGSGLVGIGARQSLCRRVEVRRQIALGLELLQGELEMSMPPAAELLTRVGQRLGGPVGEVLLTAGQDMEAVPGRPPLGALRISLEELKCLDSAEGQLLLELGTCLGRYDLTGQVRALAYLRKRTEALIEQAEKQLEQKARASVTAAVCGGLALIVLLF